MLIYLVSGMVSGSKSHDTIPSRHRSIAKLTHSCIRSRLVFEIDQPANLVRCSIRWEATVRNVAIFRQIAILIICLSACSTAAPATPTPILRTKTGGVDNTGDLCFNRYDANALVLTGEWLPRGDCFSSSCTRRDEESLIITRTADDRELRFTSHARLVQTTGTDRGCTADCMGGGRVPFTLTQILPTASYTIWHGANMIGQLNMSAFTRVCLK